MLPKHLTLSIERRLETRDTHISNLQITTSVLPDDIGIAWMLYTESLIQLSHQHDQGTGSLTEVFIAVDKIVFNFMSY